MSAYLCAVDLELTDRIAVVTGASKGIGLAIVEELVNVGAAHVRLDGFPAISDAEFEASMSPRRRRCRTRPVGSDHGL